MKQITNLNYSSKPCKVLTLAMVGVCFSAAALSQTKDSSQALSANLAQNFFRVSDVSVVMVGKIDANSADIIAKTNMTTQAKMALRKKVALAEIKELTNDLTDTMRKAGFPVARVLVSDDDFLHLAKTEELRFSVFPGRVGRITVENKSQVNTARIQKTLGSALCDSMDENGVCRGEAPLMSAALERAAYNLNDLEGVRTGLVSFSPDNVGPGETSVHVVVESQASSSIAINMDNYGALSTGLSRLGLSGKFSNLFAAADVMQLYAIETNKRLYNGGINLSLPVGYSGLSAVLDISKLTYSVSGVVSQGISDNIALGFGFPIIRGYNKSVRFNLLANHSKGESELNGVTLVNSEHSSAQLSLAGDGAAAVGPELYEWRMGVTRGNVVIGDPGQLQMDRLSAKTVGLFNKGAYSFLIQKNLSNGASAPYIRMHVRGQWASKNLDGYEKFALGGPAGVRSYASDNVSVDEGVIASFDVRKSFQAEGLPLVVGGFYDFSTGAINQKPWQLGFENNVIRRGFGVSLDIQPTTQSVLSLLLARPVGPERGAENYQFWATARFKY